MPEGPSRLSRNFQFEFCFPDFIIPAMTSLNHRVRRATLDDLPGLKALWNSMHLPADDLERRLTEFQLVETSAGRLVGTLGFQISAQQGWLHSESYEDFAVADDVRPLLFERLKSLAANHGVLRLWTLEKSPFWTRQSFQPATPEALKKLPESWAASGPGWLTLQLKDEAAIVSLEKELALFMETEKRRTEQVLGQARTIKSIATAIAVILAVCILVAAAYLLLKDRGMLAPVR
jgi:N-acetylglutamate synthase-like GNAT family acetyltransferase